MIRPVQTIQRLKNGAWVAIGALGDSLTYGWMVRKGYLDFWQEMMQEKYPSAHIEVINAGIPGDTAAGGRLRLRRDVLSYNPYCILIQYALNDAYQGYSPEEFAGNLKAIVEEVRTQSTAEVALLTSVFLNNPREDAFIQRYYDRLESIATAYQLPLVRVHELWRKRVAEHGDFGRLVQDDLVHPTEEGYRLMAEAVMDVFREE